MFTTEVDMISKKYTIEFSTRIVSK